MSQSKLVDRAAPFLNEIESWVENLPILALGELAAEPDRVAILSSDMINGFCRSGALSSPRVEALIEPITSLFQAAWDLGVRHILLSQDTHDPAAVEFEAYAPHCIRGTEEAEPVAEFKSLPFFNHMLVIEKNTISSHLDTALNDWIEGHPRVDTFIVVGDCTDICVYQAAMHLRIQANAQQIQRRVIVPQNCVNTYDLDVHTARELGVLPHDGDLLHHVFLYHMALNKVEVIQGFHY